MLSCWHPVYVKAIYMIGRSLAMYRSPPFYELPSCHPAFILHVSPPCEGRSFTEVMLGQRRAPRPRLPGPGRGAPPGACCAFLAAYPPHTHTHTHAHDQGKDRMFNLLYPSSSTQMPHIKNEGIFRSVFWELVARSCRSEGTAKVGATESCPSFLCQEH